MATSNRDRLHIRPSPLTRFRLVVSMACGVVLLLAALVVQSRALWSPDELRYAQIVQRMDRLADLFVLRLWENVYTEKPPLFFWLVRAFVPFTGGIYLATLLVPIATASCLLLWLTGCVARRWYGKRSGTSSVIVLVTLPLFLLLSSIGRMDMLLALFVTAGVFALYRGYVEQSAACRIWAFVWMGAGLLAKGPFGVIFPLAIAATALIISGKFHRLWCGETLMGICIVLGMVACWLGPAVWLAGKDYVTALAGKQLFDRAVVGVDHGEPVFFYLWVLPIILLPWVLFLIPAVRISWIHWRDRQDERELWLLCWLGVPLLILSLVREKLPVYLLPAMPPTAVLIGRYWSEVLASGQISARFRFRVMVFFGLCIGLGVMGLAASLVVSNSATAPNVRRLGDIFVASQHGEIGWLMLDPLILCAGGTIIAILATVGWVSMRTASARGVGWVFATLASVAPCAQLFITLAIMPALDPGLSWHAVATAIHSVQDSGDPVIAYGLRPFAAYYTNDDVIWFKKQHSLAEFIQRNGSIWCATREEELDEIRRNGVVEQDSDRRYPSPSGPVLLVHIRPLAVAERARD